MEKGIILPNEIRELSDKVQADKQIEVSSTLNTIFVQTENWKVEVDAIEVNSIEDKEAIKQADLLRSKAKNARIKYEKVFDVKRAEVQARMVDDKLEDTLYLRAKQVMQAKLKAIEELAEYKATFVKRYEAEQKELKMQLRQSQVSKYDETITRFDFDSMSDLAFSTFLIGLEQTHNARVAEAKRIEEEAEQKRKEELEEQKRIQSENAKLKAEAEKREAELAKERTKSQEAQAELDRKQAQEEKEKADAEEKARQEASEKKKAEKNKKYKAWQEANGFDPVSMKIEQDGNTFTLWKKLSVIEID